MKTRLSIDGKKLLPQDVFDIAHDPRMTAALAFEANKLIATAAAYTSSHTSDQIIYGINTGFGPMANRILGKDHVEQLQLNLVRSHACGMGEPLPFIFSRAALTIRANTMAKGYSGVSPDLIKLLITMLNTGISPVIFEHGAVGTSGDLVQLAHIALSVVGEGQVWYKGEIVPTATAFQKQAIKPYKLKAKEGLSLINGTSFMSGVGCFDVVLARRFLDLATLHAAIALELVEAFDDGISKELHMVRPHPGQVKVAENMRSLLGKSKRLRKRHTALKEIHITEEILKLPSAIQEIYSLRCSPQILGPLYEEVTRAEETMRIEINSVTDNPVVYAEGGSKQGFYHGGNFHGDYVSASMDKLKASLIKATMLSERRINFFFNENVNKTFPPFLNIKTPGLTLALQALQFVATSTTAQSQTFGYPHHLHSISTNADNQDVVSMGSESALLTYKVLQNAFIVLAVESAALCQALDIVNELDMCSDATKKYYHFVRKIFPKILEDRPTYAELNLLSKELQSYEKDLI